MQKNWLEVWEYCPEAGISYTAYRIMRCRGKIPEKHHARLIDVSEGKITLKKIRSLKKPPRAKRGELA